MKIRITLLLVFVLLTQMVNAQAAYSFKVLVSKGKSEIKTANAWEVLKVGATLKSTDEVKVSENSYLGLVDTKGKPMEIRQPRVYKVTELLASIKPTTSVLNKYTDFILSSNTEKKGRLTATGAVHRGFKDVIMLYLPASESAGLLGDKVGIQWTAEEVKGPYEVVFTSLLEDELARFQTNENQIIVDMNSGNLKDTYEILVKVVSKTSKGKGSKDYIIKKLRPADREKFEKSWAEVKATATDQTALSKYIMAGYYEENLLILDALTAYQEAIRLAPDVSLYSDSYKEFLKRLGFEVKE